jgi:NAD-dependent SIR2 family protein deacetylase
MTCWHCNNELEFNDSQTADATKIYHCAACDKWYEMRKERARVNGAVPIRFVELEGSPDL